MSGFLANMINRHLGRVETVQPRMRSMFEPDSSPGIRRDSDFSLSETGAVRDSLNTRIETQAKASGPSNLEKSPPQNPQAGPLPMMIRESAEADEYSRILEPNPRDDDRVDLMHEQIQALRARLSQKSKPSESEPPK